MAFDAVRELLIQDILHSVDDGLFISHRSIRTPFGPPRPRDRTAPFLSEFPTPIRLECLPSLASVEHLVDTDRLLAWLVGKSCIYDPDAYPKDGHPGQSPNNWKSQPTATKETLAFLKKWL